MSSSQRKIIKKIFYNFWDIRIWTCHGQIIICCLYVNMFIYLSNKFGGEAFETWVKNSPIYKNVFQTELAQRHWTSVIGDLGTSPERRLVELLVSSQCQSQASGRLQFGINLSAEQGCVSENVPQSLRRSRELRGRFSLIQPSSAGRFIILDSIFREVFPDLV